MKKIACIILLLAMVVCGGVNADVINFDVPPTVGLGDTIVIAGTSTINPGTTMTITLYSQQGSIKEIEQQSFTIQSGGDWSAKFQTDDLSPGTYKIGVSSPGDIDFGSSSTTTVLFQIIDRTAEIEIASPLKQEFNGYLKVAGRSTTRGDKGIEIMVDDGEGNIILPEQWIETNSNGQFIKNVEIQHPGNYYVSFSDTAGLIRHQEFTSVSTETASPTTTSTGSDTQTKTMSAQSFASYTSPAYFSIQTNAGELSVKTSKGHNWVMEYSTDSGTIRMVNNYADNTAESFTIPVPAGTVYVKVYPAETSDSGYVTLYATGASSITVNDSAPAVFESESTPSATQSGFVFPIGLLSCIIAVALAAFALRR
ncbi:hypothetical protein J2128_000209 [Methanomicrobium sp. W14]|uniref:hypothetical protein n=1 Tax=Methanomicrobium sp. W14 TaxID=2817839 RepID=UPI001AE50B4F|nr:hypothetical protein [Methanomicrobium sp. W14]MBP2132288.1 hypothetical protein [Methanomicrobium sp. W14]